MTFYSSGAPGRPKWKTIKGTIGASDSLDVETTAFSTLWRSVYEISLFNETEDKYKSLTLHVARVEGSDLKDTIAARLGTGNLNVRVDTVKVANDVIIRLTNNESFDVEVFIETLKIKR